MEKWKSVRGYEGLYEVSNEGNVRSLDRIMQHKRYGDMHRKGKILKPRRNGAGYLSVRLCNNGVEKDIRVHRLVADAFVGRVSGKDYVNHKDGNKENNNARNLEWVTQSENVLHAFEHGLIDVDAIQKANILNRKRVGCSNGKQYESVNAASKALGLNLGGVSRAANKKGNHCGGLSFWFVD